MACALWLGGPVGPLPPNLKVGMGFAPRPCGRGSWLDGSLNSIGSGVTSPPLVVLTGTYNPDFCNFWRLNYLCCHPNHSPRNSDLNILGPDIVKRLGPSAWATRRSHPKLPRGDFASRERNNLHWRILRVFETQSRNTTAPFLAPSPTTTSALVTPTPSVWRRENQPPLSSPLSA